MEIILSKDDLIELIKEKYQVDGEITFLLKEETFKCGVDDIGNIYSKRVTFNGVKIEK